MTALEKYQVWCEKATEDADVVRELREMAGRDSDITERFSVDLAFGTGGLRGVIGAGTSLMNIYTVRRATQGLANVLRAQNPNASVAIAYDSRIKSELFAREAAGVMAANGLQVWIYPELMPTPMLSFAVRALDAQGGINVTASHNPSKYNGYKVYGADGCQMTDADAGRVFDEIQQIDLFDDVRHVSFDDGLKAGTIRFIGDDVREQFMQQVMAQCIHSGAVRDERAESDLHAAERYRQQAGARSAAAAGHFARDGGAGAGASGRQLPDVPVPEPGDSAGV